MLDKIEWLWRYYRKYLYVLFVLLFFTPIQTSIQVLIPRMIDFTIDFLDTGSVPNDFLAEYLVSIGSWFDLTPTLTFGLGFIMLGLISALLYSFVQGHRAWMNLKLEWLFRQEAFNGITEKGPDFFNRFRTGDLVTRMTDDVADKLSWFACSGIFRFYEALMIIIFTVTMMIKIDPWLTLWAAGPLPILILIFFKTSSVLDKRYDHLQSRISIFNDVMEACFSGIRVVKAYVREKAQKNKFEEAALDRRKAEIDTVKTHTIVESMYFYIWQLSILIILITGGYFILNADISRGKLGSFLFYTVWLVFPMFDIGQFLVKSRQSAVSINRLSELEEMAPMVSDIYNREAGNREKSIIDNYELLPLQYALNNQQHNDGISILSNQSYFGEFNNRLPIKTFGDNGSKPKASPETFDGDIIFDKVDFKFENMAENIISDVTLKIEKGSTVAIVGKVGSGKSWLINMLPRLVDPTGGSISVGGHQLKEFRLEDLRRNIGYVPQEPVLFSDTIRNNILMGREDVSGELLEWSIGIAQLDKEIAGFPKGLETFIGTRGMSISGGQKQRLALARALVGQPSLLILDDCTSALDSKTESALWDKLHEVLPGMTAVIITHRPDTLERSDEIFVLENGSLAENGTHYDLISRGGHYSKIYKRYQLEESVKQ